ncbi:ELMO domain-containing protein 1-like [Argonauta hians]
MRRLTGKTELQRILDKSQPGALTTKLLERSLRRSRHPKLKNLLTDEADIGTSVITVLHAKSIPNDLCAELTLRMSQIIGYNHLISTVDTIRRLQHQDRLTDYNTYLRELWRTLKPDEPLKGLKSKQWSDIGFQGNEPHTDLRGMGMLGLTQLWYFVVTYPHEAKKVYSHSLHPLCGYPFGIVSISMTSMLVKLLRQGQLRLHFYNVCRGSPSVTHFHEAFCCLFYQFDDHWVTTFPKDIMEFNSVSDQFLTSLTSKLASHSHIMKLDFQKSIP